MTTPEDVSGTNDVPQEVINEVAGYYLVDLRGSPNIPPHTQRSESWRKMAQRFPFYSERILRFREACQTARKADETTLGVARLTFHQVVDPIARNILGDLLMARRISVPFERGRTFFQEDQNIWFNTAADKMAAELGFRDNHREEVLGAITPDEIIKAVLNEKLNLSARTPFPLNLTSRTE